MNTLIKEIIFFVGSIVFVNVMLFDIVEMSRKSISFGFFFLTQISLTVFILFMYLIMLKEKNVF